jgi:glycosyltransferase involved in cell wall biosynthesis
LAPVSAAEAGVAVDPAAAVLFVGGPMGINVHGVTWFIERVLPAVRRQVPEAELWLAGGIGERVPAGPGVRRLGFVDSLDEVYRRAAVVVNPQQFGTGLSIKSIEALRHGRPLVSTESGARGLEDGAGLAFRQAASAEDFGEQLAELLRSPAEAEALAARGLAYARAYYERNLEVLVGLVRSGRAAGTGQPGATSR